MCSKHTDGGAAGRPANKRPHGKVKVVSQPRPKQFGRRRHEPCTTGSCAALALRLVGFDSSMCVHLQLDDSEARGMHQR